MKKTEYFIAQIQYHQAKNGLDSVVNQRNDFINKNVNNIEKIDSEDIKTTDIAGNRILFTLRLTYYPKK